MGAGILLAAEWAVYDPKMYVRLYRVVYPFFFTAPQMTVLQKRLNVLFQGINVTVLLFCAALLFRYFWQSPRVRYIRNSTLGVAISFSLLVGAYLFLFSGFPTNLVKYSRIADMTTYNSVRLYSHTEIYFVFPLVFLALGTLAVFTMRRHSLLRADMDNKSLQIAQRIDASAVTMRTFCHYMKNEILALSTELSELSVADESRALLRQIQEHCDLLGTRLNEIHQNVRDNTVQLTSVSLPALLNGAMDDVRLQKRLDDIIWEMRIPAGMPEVLVDSEHFRQAVINIIENAIEALEASSRADKRLVIEAQYNAQWVTLCVCDNGPGIRQEDMVNIFTPLYSSKPLRYNWGIGLSIAYKIVGACNGRLSVDSKPGEGTTFEILLPNIDVR